MRRANSPNLRCGFAARWDVGIPTLPTGVFVLMRNKTLRTLPNWYLF